jgi:hypothetical protein
MSFIVGDTGVQDSTLTVVVLLDEGTFVVLLGDELHAAATTASTTKSALNRIFPLIRIATPYFYFVLFCYS